jgi:hypothetical protein
MDKDNRRYNFCVNCRNVESGVRWINFDSNRCTNRNFTEVGAFDTCFNFESVHRVTHTSLDFLITKAEL